MGLWNQFSAVMLRQRGHLFCWVPVCLALGIGWYFSLRAEPSGVMLAAVACVVVVLAVVARALPEVTAPFAVAAALVLLGVLLAAFRAHSVAAPVRCAARDARSGAVGPGAARAHTAPGARLTPFDAPRRNYATARHAGDDHGASVAARRPGRAGRL